MDRRAILIVDDEPDWRTLFFGYLSADYDVIAVGERSSAERAIASRQFDLVVLDLRLQDQDSEDQQGMDLLHAIRQNDYKTGRKTKVMVVSAYDTKGLVRDAFARYGLDDYLEKKELNQNKFVTMVRQLTC